MALVDRTSEHFTASCKSYYMPTSKEEALELIKGMDEFALDFETTGLDPEYAEVRLSSIYNEDTHLLVDHFFIGHFEDYVEALEGKKIWVYNGKFEQKFIDHYNPSESITVLDVDFLKKSKRGGSHSSLAAMARDIGIKLEKDEQNSDWSRLELTRGQLDYAAFDSYVTYHVKDYWWNQMTPPQREAMHIFNDSIRATVECEDTGLILDYGTHMQTVNVWKTKHATFERTIRRYTPESIIQNLNSDVQLGKFLENELSKSLLDVWPKTAKTKRLKMENSYLRGVARRLPYPMSRWMAAVVGYRYYNKYLSTYGDTLLTKQALSGKITSRFNIGQAATGRYSSSNSNLQNIPRKTLVRRAFYSPPLGEKTMVLADYSGIEIRVLAELSDDHLLREDAIYGDVHSASASQLYGHDYQFVLDVLADKGETVNYQNLYPIIKEQRSKAKGFTFQLLYGAGPSALSDVLRCSYDDAVEAIEKWAERYHNAYYYRSKMFDIMNETGSLPVCDGRTIYVHKLDRSMPVAANYPIQGAAASVMYRALYHTRELFLEHSLDAYLAATVHDEILTYAHKDHAEEAMEQQLEGMRRGWLDIFPGTDTNNLTDSAIGNTWAAKP